MSTLNHEKFLQDFSAQFENTDSSLFTMDTIFRDLEEWDSLTALSIIAMADEEYQVKLTGDDLRASETVAELFQKIKNKLD